MELKQPQDLVSLKLAIDIGLSSDFRKLLWTNYLEYGDGRTMKEYAQIEKELLSKRNYGVEDFYLKVNAYITFLNRVI